MSGHYEARVVKDVLRESSEQILTSQVSVKWSPFQEEPPSKRRQIWSGVEIISCCDYIYSIGSTNLTALGKVISKESITNYIQLVFHIEFGDYIDKIKVDVTEKELASQKKIFDALYQTKQQGSSLKLNEDSTLVLEELAKDLENISFKVKNYLK